MNASSARLQDLASLASQEHLPALFIDLDAFDANAAQVERIVSASGRAPSVRLATKSVRVPALLRRVLDRGGPWRGLMTFAADETALLADQGFDDLLLAYPTVQRRELERLRVLHERGVDVKLVVDADEHLLALKQVMAGVSRPFPVVVDLDASLRLGPRRRRAHIGVRRSPVRGPDDALALFRAADGPLRPIGVMAYEAQVAGLPDENPFKRGLNSAARLIRRASTRAVARRRAEVRRALEAAGFSVELMNGGGSGSLDTSARDPSLTEVTAGSALFCPHLFDYYSNVRFRPAAFFALPVVRASDPGFVTCAGGGYIASGEPGWDRVPLPVWPPGLSLVSTEGCGEVQTPLRFDVSKNVQLKVGDVVLFRHAKAGEVAERFNDAVLVGGSGPLQVRERVKTYRGLGACFL